MRILVTAGNTQSDIDQVRCITNVFSGRTCANVAMEAARRGHEVRLLTSRPDQVDDDELIESGMLVVHTYRTFGELDDQLAESILTGNFDAIIHGAAVSDYQTAGVYCPPQGTTFDDATNEWNSSTRTLQFDDVQSGKVKSHHREIWIRLVPTPKLVDKFRRDWGFQGLLAKFKLEVDVTNRELLAIAEASRQQSRADLIVANTLGGMTSCAWIGGSDGTYDRVPRPDLARQLIDRIEAETREVSERRALAHLEASA